MHSLTHWELVTSGYNNSLFQLKHDGTLETSTGVVVSQHTDPRAAWAELNASAGFIPFWFSSSFNTQFHFFDSNLNLKVKIKIIYSVHQLSSKQAEVL